MEILIEKRAFALVIGICLLVGCRQVENPQEENGLLTQEAIENIDKRNSKPNSVVEWPQNSRPRPGTCLAYWRNKKNKLIDLASFPISSDSSIQDCSHLNGITTFKDTLHSQDFSRWPHQAIGQLLVTFEICGKTITKPGTAWLVDVGDGKNRYLITASHVIMKKIQCGANASTTKVFWPKHIVFAPNDSCDSFYCVKNAFVFQEFTYNPARENQYDFAGIVLEGEVDCDIRPIPYKVLSDSADMDSALAYGITDKPSQLQHPSRLTRTGSDFCMPSKHHYRMENSLTKGGSGGPVVVSQNDETFAFSINGWRKMGHGEGNFLYLPRPKKADIDSMFTAMKRSL